MFGTGILLFLSIVIEVTSTALLPRTAGLTSLSWSVVVLAGYLASAWMLAIVVRTLPVSVTYAIWAGVGPAAVAIIGWLFLHESMSWLKAASLALITVGVIGISLAPGNANHREGDDAGTQSGGRPRGESRGPTICR